MGKRYETYNIVNDNLEPVWQTSTGVKIPFSEVTHQHWSNIYWYHKYLVEMAKEEMSERENNDYSSLWDYVEEKLPKFEYLMNFGLKQLNDRFDGKILDWKPKYENEIKWFKEQQTRKILLEFVRNKVEKKEEDLG